MECVGPPALCEKLYQPVECPDDKPYCINKIINRSDGTRGVWRGCGNYDTCYKDWFLGSSDIDKCRLFNQDNFITLKFDCTFCCYGQDKYGKPLGDPNIVCNQELKPPDEYIYRNF